MVLQHGILSQSPQRRDHCCRGSPQRWSPRTPGPRHRVLSIVWQRGCSSTPTTMPGRTVPRARDTERRPRSVCLADSGATSSWLRKVSTEIQGAWLHCRAGSLDLVHLPPSEVILAKWRGSNKHQKCWCQGFYKVPRVLQHLQQGALGRYPVELCPVLVLKVDL